MAPEWLFIVGVAALLLLKLTCLTLGYLVVKTGAQLLRDGIAGEFKFKAEIPGAKGDLVSASPGLLFLLLGVLLIGYGVAIDKPLTYKSAETPADTKPQPKLPEG
ncbi:MAG TPA: hypothetical protein VGD66_14350 [Allosphingosinicella sp.]|jgi:hypothetical protein